ncbi:MAG TPA: BON domain-containing protein [Chryseolinea sp.]
MNSDDEIRKNVIAEIEQDPQLAKIAAQIGVTVCKEVVTLSGKVDYYSQKVAAEKAAQRVRGVRIMAVDIEVRSASDSEVLTDSKIGEAIKITMHWHSVIPEDLLEVKVEDGWVYLNGTVNWEYERSAVEKAIENIRGVKGVFNKIAIRNNAVKPAEVKKKIMAAFHRHATVDAANIKVSVVGSKLTLSGNVRSWQERKDAESIVWLMPGVTHVVNELELETSVLMDGSLKLEQN